MNGLERLKNQIDNNVHNKLESFLVSRDNLTDIQSNKFWGLIDKINNHLKEIKLKQQSKNND